MNNKMITAVVVVVLAVIGFGAVALKNNENKPASNVSEPIANHNSSDTNTTPSTSNNETSSNEVVEANNVTYKNFDVVQKIIKVKKGTTVTWTNEDSAKHDVTPDTETADFKASELFGKGETYSVTFNTVGTYTYHCSPHPYMKGTIEVVE